jgi:acetylglutamate kinase
MIFEVPLKTNLEKAAILVEALPYIREFVGKTVVIKYGGAAMVHEGLKKSVAEDLVLMKTIGINPVVVHGGGPEITAAMKKLGKAPTFVNGLRVTDKETMEITEMVLVGKINQQIVGYINQFGALAAGVSGKDGNLLLARKHTGKSLKTGKSGVDLGYVGEVEKVNGRILEALDSEGFVPIISPVGYGKDGHSYNCNADMVAGAVAASLKAEKLILLTDQPGLLRDVKDPGSLIASLTLKEVPGLVRKGVIDAGMLPKIEACQKALRAGVLKTHIIDGRVPHALLLEIFTNQGIGTEITK